MPRPLLRYFDVTIWFPIQYSPWFGLVTTGQLSLRMAGAPVSAHVEGAGHLAAQGDHCLASRGTLPSLLIGGNQTQVDMSKRSSVGSKETLTACDDHADGDGVGYPVLSLPRLHSLPTYQP